MDIQKDDDFEEWYENHKPVLLVENIIKGTARAAWQAAKAQAVPKGYKVVPANYECVWCGCTELDGWTDEAMLAAQESK